jgi:polysaccharide export outer membrane protein
MIQRQLFVFLFLAALGQALSQQAKIQKGDILEINVYNHPDLSKAVMVQNDGSVDYPLISNIPLDGMTVEEFRNILITQVARFLGERPVITVWFAQTLNVYVTVLGQVNQPGQYPVPKNATVQGAVTRAGGFTPRAQLDKIRIIRKNGGGAEKIVAVDMAKFFLSGDVKILPDLEEGDVVLVPGAPGTYDVKVLGEVRIPGSYPVTLGATVLDVIFMAGGYMEKADPKRIKLYSPSRSTSQIVSLTIDDLFKNSIKANVPAVTPGDVVYVPKKRINVMDILKTITAIATPVALILYYTGVLRAP